MTASTLLIPNHLDNGRVSDLALSGLPDKIDNQAVRYVRKEVIRSGKYVDHKNKDFQFSITPQRMDKWVENFKVYTANGNKPFVPARHRDFDARDNFGWVTGLDREGDSLFATLQLVGEDAHKAAARNDVSISVQANYTDGKGQKYDEVLDHIALCPDPVIPGLSSFQALAASSGLAGEVHLLQLAAQEPDMQFLEQLRGIFGADKNATEEQILSKVKEIKTAADRVPTLENEKLQLSQRPAPFQMPDEFTLGLVSNSFEQMRPKVAALIGPDATDKLMKVFVPSENKPTQLALSKSGTAQNKTLMFEVLEILAGATTPPRTGEATLRQSLVLAHQPAADGAQPTDEQIKQQAQERARAAGAIVIESK